MFGKGLKAPGPSMHADRVSQAMNEADRYRMLQCDYDHTHSIATQTIRKAVNDPQAKLYIAICSTEAQCARRVWRRRPTHTRFARDRRDARESAR